MLYNSDYYTMYVCAECGHIAWYNRRKKVFECPIHGEEGDVKPVKVPYAFKLLLQEITSMVIKPEIKVDEKISLMFDTYINRERDFDNAESSGVELRYGIGKNNFLKMRVQNKESMFGFEKRNEF
jgi:hypothetical protein